MKEWDMVARDHGIGIGKLKKSSVHNYLTMLEVWIKHLPKAPSKDSGPRPSNGRVQR